MYLCAYGSPILIENAGIGHQLMKLPMEQIVRTKHSRTPNAKGLLCLLFAITAVAALTSCGGTSGGPPPPPPPPPVTASETVLYRFTGASDGGGPSGGIALDTAGNVYGSTQFSGPTVPVWGTVYRLSPSGQLTVLHSFQNMPDG